MVPQILHRVIHGRVDPEPWQKDLLKFQPAVLHGYKRHRVRGQDYPGILPVKSSNESDKSAAGATSVLGTLVSGLTDGDIYRLDIFEGDEYLKQKVTVRLLQSEDGESNLQDVLTAAGAENADGEEEVSAVTYVWAITEEALEQEEWDFETFKRDKLAAWVGADERQWQTM